MCHVLYIPECTEASSFSPYIVDDIFTSNFAIENVYIFEISLKFIHWCFVVQPLVSTCNDFMLNIGYAIHIYWSVAFKILIPGYPLELRHNERDGVSNHQPHDCSLNRLFRRRSKKTSKLSDQRKHQSFHWPFSVLLAFGAGKSPVPVNSPHQRPVTRKMFPFDDVIMQPSNTLLEERWGCWYSWLHVTVFLFNLPSQTVV